MILSLSIQSEFLVALRIYVTMIPCPIFQQQQQQLLLWAECSLLLFLLCVAGLCLFSLIFVSELDDSTWLSMAPWAKASDMMLGPIRVVYGNLWAAACFVHSLAANTVLCRREDCFHALLMSGITGG